MDDRKNSIVNQIGEKYICYAILTIMLLLIGINVFRIYNDHIAINHSQINFFYNNVENILSDKGSIVLSIEENYPLLEVMINGRVVNKFEENKSIVVNITNGDVVQINGSMYSNDIRVNIVDKSSNINNYFSSDKGIINQNIITLAIIKM